MKATRNLFVCLISLVFAVPTVYAQDFSKYRSFSLGSNLPTVLRNAGQKMADVKLICSQPALIQEVTWWLPNSSGAGQSEAVREIVKSRHESFPSVLIKALLSEISVFPPGTVVRLNTEEIGRVIAVNRNHPLRPRIEVVADSRGNRLSTPKVIDLSESPFLYVTGPVSEGNR